MGDETQKTINFGDKLSEFSSCLSFFLSTSTAATYIFPLLLLPVHNYNNYSLEPCALNAEFLNFVLRFYKNFLTLQIPRKEGIRGETRSKDRVKTV
jgi:hypothetical protein